jgi:DNA-binding CsgD family transcriptional regulator
MARRGRPRHDDILTPAEWRVVELVRHGLSTAKIAALLGISADAVKGHADAAKGKLGLKTRAELRQWAGVRKGSARRPREDAPFGPVSQIARQVEKLDRAREFLKSIGVRELYAFPGLAFFALGDVRLMLRETGTREAADILYFQVPDIGAAHARLVAMGIAFTGAPHMIHRHADGAEEWMAFFADDEGRPLALHSVARP